MCYPQKGFFASRHLGKSWSGYTQACSSTSTHTPIMSYNTSPIGSLEGKAALPAANNESCSDYASSQTSTDLYGQEPFETFVQKVHSLLLARFADELPILMERMSGGSYNRVVGGVLGQ